MDVSTVVRHEDENGVLGQLEFVEFIEKLSNAFIDASKHRSHDRVALFAGRIFLFGKLGGVAFFMPPWAMYAVLPEVDKERLVAFLLDEANGFVG